MLSVKRKNFAKVYIYKVAIKFGKEKNAGLLKT